MRRIQVIGGSAAGKSTVSKQLGELLDIEVTHLDQVLWKDGCRLVDKTEEPNLVRPLIERDRWIIDGNYTASLPMRLERADTIIIVDAPRRAILWGAARRWFKHHGQTRPSMGGDCPERFNAEFLRWIWRYPKEERPVLLQQLRRHGSHASLVLLRSRGEIEQWIEQLRGLPRDQLADHVPKFVPQ